MTAFCPTAAFNENIMPFMSKWLRDLASELGPDVSMPQVVPNILGNQQDGAAFWGNVVTVLPWTLYRAYGSIGNWLYTKLCGLEILEPGYKKFALRPQFIKGITHAELTYESVYGKIAIAWRCEGGKITVDATVPANTTAELTLPEQTETLTLGSGSYRYEYATETGLEIDRYSLETPLHIILGHPAAQAIFRQYAPEFLENPMLEYVKDEPITALLVYGEAMRPLFEQVLTAMNQADKR